jgi:hypothetical protein
MTTRPYSSIPLDDRLSNLTPQQERALRRIESAHTVMQQGRDEFAAAVIEAIDVHGLTYGLIGARLGKDRSDVFRSAKRLRNRHKKRSEG